MNVCSFVLGYTRPNGWTELNQIWYCDEGDPAADRDIIYF